ncbi:MAG: tRNA-binding protein [Alkalispirochaetaceae bacterium]
MIEPETFFSVEMRVGRIIAAEPFEKARKRAYKLRIDFGELGIKRSSAQITELYSPKDLVGRRVVAVVNLPPKQIADTVSECLVLGVDSPKGGVSLLRLDEEAGGEIPLGTRVY